LRRAYVAAVALIVILALTVAFGIYYAWLSENRVTLKVLCAGSLMFPLERIEEAFEKSHPDVDVQIEDYGSIQVIRQVTELGKDADVLMVADYSLIPIMMYNTTIPNTNQSYATWYIRFASNSVVLAYTNQSKYANEINATNWYKILARSDVKFGFPNPFIDALGYRVLFTIQLAEIYYQNSSIFEQLITPNFDPAFGSIKVNGTYVITVPETQTPVGGKILIRASSIPLIPLLEAGSIDYCFLYLSNAKQYGFSYVELPSQINLGSPEYQQYYQQVRVEFQYQRFASIGLDREGKTIYYGLTIPQNAPHPELAAEFVEFILNGEGKTIFEDCWQPVYQPAFTDNLQIVPEKLQSLVVNEP
jgi:molybdate/tungstate transport system substrate-binding protein